MCTDTTSVGEISYVRYMGIYKLHMDGLHMVDTYALTTSLENSLCVLYTCTMMCISYFLGFSGIHSVQKYLVLWKQKYSEIPAFGMEEMLKF